MTMEVQSAVPTRRADRCLADRARRSSTCPVNISPRPANLLLPKTANAAVGIGAVFATRMLLHQGSLARTCGSGDRRRGEETAKSAVRTPL